MPNLLLGGQEKEVHPASLLCTHVTEETVKTDKFPQSASQIPPPCTEFIQTCFMIENFASPVCC